MGHMAPQTAIGVEYILEIPAMHLDRPTSYSVQMRLPADMDYILIETGRCMIIEQLRT